MRVCDSHRKISTSPDFDIPGIGSSISSEQIQYRTQRRPKLWREMAPPPAWATIAMHSTTSHWHFAILYPDCSSLGLRPCHEARVYASACNTTPQPQANHNCVLSPRRKSYTRWSARAISSSTSTSAPCICTGSEAIWGQSWRGRELRAAWPLASKLRSRFGPLVYPSGNATIDHGRSGCRCQCWACVAKH